MRKRGGAWPKTRSPTGDLGAQVRGSLTYCGGATNKEHTLTRTYTHRERKVVRNEGVKQDRAHLLNGLN